MIISSAPPRDWDNLCQTHNCLFHSSHWQNLLACTFSAESVYILDEENNNGLAITVFKAGIFHIGYIGFPVGSSITAEVFPEEKLSRALSGKLPTKIHLLRTPVSAFAQDESLKQAYTETRETAITDLQHWNEEELPSSTKRNIRKALKTGVNIINADSNTDARILYKLYHDTVRRHHGSLRYNEKYFSEIVKASTKLSNLRVLIAQFEGKIAGYIVIGLNNNTAYYLHGASNAKYQIYRPNDLLFLSAIQWAKNEKMDTFNMMSSPINQPTLVRYKEKWLGQTGIHKTYEKDISPIFSHCFRLANSLYQALPNKLFRR